MRTIDDIERKLKADALTYYHREFKSARDRAIRIHMCDCLADRFKRAGFNTYSGLEPPWVNLKEHQNITRDVAVFLDDNKDFLTLLGGSSEYKVEEEGSYIILKWPKFYLFIDYSNGACERVKTGEKLVVKETYKVQCN